MTLLKLSQITLAATRLNAMVDFYNGSFEASLLPFEGYNTTLYRGTLGGIPFLICPNEVAGVRAEQGRHQLHLTVSNLRQAAARVEEMGGTVLEEMQDEDGARVITVRDPDGNTLVLTGQA